MTGDATRANEAIRIGVSLPFGVANLKAGVPGSDSDEKLRKSTPMAAETVAVASRAIEDAGLDSAWLADVLSRGFSTPDPLIAAAVAATATHTIEIGIGILQVPLREPVDLAHRILTATLVCGGRLVVGVGAGSTRADFDAVGENFDSRADELALRLKTMRALWRGEQVKLARFQPWPGTDGGPPLLVGSWTAQRRIEAAAAEGMGWIGSGAMSTWATVERAARNFKDAGGTRAVLTSVEYDSGPDTSVPAPDTAVSLCCAPDEAVRRLVSLREMGFTDIVVTPPSWEAHILAGLARLRDLASNDRSAVSG